MEDLPQLVPEDAIALVDDPVVPQQGDQRVLPFSFAKRHGVLIRPAEDGSLEAVYRSTATPLSLAEARRFAGRRMKMTRVTPDAFDGLLQQAYEQGSHKAMQMVGDLDEHTDLLQVAQEMPEPSDLLESDDDAP
ncbi:MAG: hypothetical protein WBM68_05645, partial [Woeseia sp.]